MTGASTSTKLSACRSMERRLAGSVSLRMSEINMVTKAFLPAALVYSNMTSGSTGEPFRFFVDLH